MPRDCVHRSNTGSSASSNILIAYGFINYKFCQQITQIERLKKDVENVEIVFAVVENGTPLNGASVAAKFDKVTLTEMDQILNYSVC